MRNSTHPTRPCRRFAPQAFFLVRHAVVGSTISRRAKTGGFPAQIHADEIFNGIIENKGDGIHSKTLISLAQMFQGNGKFETANANTLAVLDRLRLIILNLKELRETAAWRPTTTSPSSAASCS